MGMAAFQAGEVGLEPTTYGFGDRCSAKLSYSPVCGGECSARGNGSARLAMQSVLSAARAVLTQLNTAGVVAPVLFSCVVSFPAFYAFERDDGANTFLS